MTALEKQIGGTHYKNFKIQPIELIMHYNLGYCEGNIIKYICRYKNKGGAEDLNKALHYIDFLLEFKKHEENYEFTWPGLSYIEDFILVNELSDVHEAIITCIVMYNSSGDKKWLRLAAQNISILLNQIKR